MLPPDAQEGAYRGAVPGGGERVMFGPGARCARCLVVEVLREPPVWAKRGSARDGVLARPARSRLCCSALSLLAPGSVVPLYTSITGVSPARSRLPLQEPPPAHTRAPRRTRPPSARCRRCRDCVPIDGHADVAQDLLRPSAPPRLRLHARSLSSLRPSTAPSSVPPVPPLPPYAQQTRSASPSLLVPTPRTSPVRPKTQKMPSAPNVSLVHAAAEGKDRSDVRTTWRPDLPEELDVDWVVEGIEMWGEPVAAPPPETVLHRLSRIRSAGSMRPGTAPTASPVSGLSLLRRSREDMHSSASAGPSGGGWGNYVPYPGAGIGSWKSVQVRVAKRGKDVVLEILDTQTPPQSVRTLLLHMMHSTDVRPIHRSLFQRPHVLSIHSHPQSLPPSSGAALSSAALQPVYVAFSHSAPLDNFLALCRSLAKPDVRGTALGRELGGLWRVWRRVSVQLLEVAGGQEAEVLLSVNRDPCALLCGPYPSPATVQLPDLPRIEHLELAVFARATPNGSPKKEKEKEKEKEKDGEKKVCVGRVEIPGTMWRNRWVDERWMFEGGGGGVKARVRMDEVQILPWTEYSPLHEGICPTHKHPCPTYSSD
ncbi:hypothetical protein CALCODRAFT_15391 [Calocera cornea HHB12733]|uniref:Uncharacterized protein n=1 Tax=Calocera cornea HHB12733 TaxID=1353952 RepID=A0A165E9X1_9BASI|nr:hypothetical protein CALCODRAFT_15391 [Calocera cornea HHB12733]